jgi:glycosyltransferase involved in cell wall biosynthesis
MSKNIKLSVVVSTYNGESRLAKCLDSVKEIADEIIVVNSGSTDKTESVAKKYTKKVYTRPNNSMLNINKNFGFSKASGEWILNLDDDEQITPELTNEIKQILDKGENGNIKGYWIPRKNIIFGKWIEHTGWYPDYQMRLFKKGYGEFPEKNIHELIKINGEIGYLRNPMIHYNYQSIHQFLNKFRIIYAPEEAKEYIAKGYKVKYLDAIRFPSEEFLSRFFVREGYKDGLHGLILSMLMAFYHFVIFILIWEEQGFKEYDNKDFFNEIHAETKNVGLKFEYWFLTVFINQTKSQTKKLLYRAMRKKINSQIKK